MRHRASTMRFCQKSLALQIHRKYFPLSEWKNGYHETDLLRRTKKQKKIENRRASWSPELSISDKIRKTSMVDSKHLKNIKTERKQIEWENHCSEKQMASHLKLSASKTSRTIFEAMWLCSLMTARVLFGLKRMIWWMITKTEMSFS